tara:strand:+ start:458 stop:709 length:252 start_codon:yes stop_codon:yes gene_type:complete
LILAAINNDTIKKLQFDCGEAVLIAGFDKKLISETENMFGPFGERMWEFGISNSKRKNIACNTKVKTQTHLWPFYLKKLCALF